MAYPKKVRPPLDNGGLLRYNHRCTRVCHRSLEVIYGNNKEAWQQLSYQSELWL